MKYSLHPTILVLFILLLKNELMAQNDSSYTKMRVTDLIKMCKEGNAVIKFQDQNTMAVVHYIKTGGNVGKYTLAPASGPWGLLIDNKETLDHILATRIPLERQDKSPFEENIEAIKNLDIKKIIAGLFQKLQIDVNPNSVTKSDLMLIQQKINAYPKENRYQDLLVPLGFFIGECILKKHSGEWVLRKEYGYNPYYIPFIKTKNFAQIDAFYKLTQKLEKVDSRKFDLIESIDHPQISENFYK